MATPHVVAGVFDWFFCPHGNFKSDHWVVKRLLLEEYTEPIQILEIPQIFELGFRGVRGQHLGRQRPVCPLEELDDESGEGSPLIVKRWVHVKESHIKINQDESA